MFINSHIVICWKHDFNYMLNVICLWQRINNSKSIFYFKYLYIRHQLKMSNLRISKPRLTLLCTIFITDMSFTKNKSVFQIVHPVSKTLSKCKMKLLDSPIPFWLSKITFLYYQIRFNCSHNVLLMKLIKLW